MQTEQSFDSQQLQRHKNKKRLLVQNKKLNTEIRKLEQDMRELLSVGKDQIQQKINATDLSKQRSQITIQQNYMKKLKNKIDFLKTANPKENSYFVRKQQDSLTIVKKQYQQLINEKQTMTRLKQDKLKKLNQNKPFQNYKESVQGNLLDVKNKNRKMNAELVQLQRQVRKYHGYIQLKKQNERDKVNSQNIQLQISKKQEQIRQIIKTTKDTQNKWKPQFQSLDRQYFQLKEDYLIVQDKLYDTQKLFKQSQTRISALRAQDQVAQFRDRLSKIHTVDPAKYAKKTQKVKRKRQPIFWSKAKVQQVNKQSSPKILKKKSAPKITQNIIIENQMSAQEKMRQAKRKAILQQKNKKKLEKEKKLLQIKQEQQKKKKKKPKVQYQKLVRNEWNKPPKVTLVNKKQQTTGADNKNIDSVTNQPTQIENQNSPKKQQQGKMILKNKGVGPE